MRSRKAAQASAVAETEGGEFKALAAAVIAVGALCCIIAANRMQGSRARPLLLQFVGFAINVASVSVPGRFDSDVQATSTMQFPWPTLLSPAGFAFAIWGIIYLGEIAGLAVLASSKAIAEDAAPSSMAWLCANVAQALWCASFRRWALDRMWLSTLCLAATAACLQISQRALVGHCRVELWNGFHPYSWLAVLVVGPRSLHAGWVTAAALVNVNAYVGMANLGAATAFAVAILSQFGGATIADWYARSGIPAAAIAIAWALFAVSLGQPVGRDAEALGAVALEGLATTAAVAAALAALASLVAWARFGGPDYALLMRIMPTV